MISFQADGGRPRSKVARVIEAYALDSLGDELERRWLATGDESMSLRALADHFNEQVLTAAIEESDMHVLDVDVETMYDQLTGDEVSSGVRTRLERRLQRNGIDVEELTGDFVTHQAIHTYLREYRDVEQPEATPAERRESARERIQKLQDRSTAVTRDTLESLQRNGLIPDGEFDVLVDVQVVYTESGEQYNALDLVDQS